MLFGKYLLFWRSTVFAVTIVELQVAVSIPLVVSCCCFLAMRMAFLYYICFFFAALCLIRLAYRLCFAFSALAGDGASLSCADCTITKS